MQSSERYCCNLNKEVLEKAVKELNEPTENDVRLAEIDKLRTRFMEEDNGMDLVRSDDAFILRFLRVRKFDQDRAYKCLCNYHEQRKMWPEVFDKVNQPSAISDFLDKGPIMSLGQIANDKTFVIYGRPGLGFKGSDDMTSFIAALVLSCEKLLENEEFQIHGVTVIEDMTHFGLSFAMQMASSGKRFLGLIQDAMPIRLKSLNMINEALVFDILYSIVSAFMKEKTKNRLQVHGSDFTKLHEKIPSNLLPKTLGGTGPDLEPAEWKKEIISSMGEGEDTAL